MRKIESQMNAAVRAGKSFSKANTTVAMDGDVAKVYLHGNLIATVGCDALTLYDGGWQTNTTKSRLNALLEEFGPRCARVFQKNFQWFVQDVDGRDHDFFNGYCFF